MTNAMQIESTLTRDQALLDLIATRTLSAPIVAALGLASGAVTTWKDLPRVTRESMVDALIDRLCDD